MKNLSKPYWLIVLEHFEKHRYIQNGLTIPFLIGAEKFLSQEDDLLSVKEFLTQIIDRKIQRQITMQRCPDIGEYVFGLVDWETNQFKEFYKKSGKNMFRELGCLNILDRSYHEIEDIDEIIRKLEEIYNPLVNDMKYSKNFGEWSSFTEKDINRISEILNKKTA